MEITKLQAESAQMTSERIQQIKEQELAQKREKDVADINLRIKEIEEKREASNTKATSKLQETQMTNEAKANDTNKNIALQLKTNNDQI